MKIIPFQVQKSNSESFRFQEDLLPFFYDRLHAHQEWQLTLILKGEGTFVSGHQISQYKPGDLYLIGSNIPHVFKSDQSPDEEENLKQSHSLSIYFDPENPALSNIPELRDCLTLFSKKGYVYLIREPQTHDYFSLLEQIRQKNSVDRLMSFYRILSLISETIDSFSPITIIHEQKNFSEKEGRRMNDIVSFTFANSHRDISIAEIAEVAHLSPEAFCRYFKLRTRKTYINFLNEIRINNACKLLDKNESPVADISFQVGFNNISNFNRIFKRITGLSPRNYMKMN